MAEGLREIEGEPTPLDLPGPTMVDPDENIITKSEPVVPKSDYNPNQYTIDSWYGDGDPENPYR